MQIFSTSLYDFYKIIFLIYAAFAGIALTIASGISLIEINYVIFWPK